MLRRLLSSEPPPRAPQFVPPDRQGRGRGRAVQRPDSGLVRSPKPLVDTPQTMTVVPRRSSRSSGPATIRDALRNVSGITVSVGEGGRRGRHLHPPRLLGPDRHLPRRRARPGLVHARHVQHPGRRGLLRPLRRSSSVVARRAAPINLVTKKPKRRTSEELVTLQGGTAPSGRLEGDVNSRAERRLAVPVSAIGQLAHVADRDQASANRAGFSPGSAGALGRAHHAGAGLLLPARTQHSGLRPPVLRAGPGRTATRSRPTSASRATPGTASWRPPDPRTSTSTSPPCGSGTASASPLAHQQPPLRPGASPRPPHRAARSHPGRRPDDHRPAALRDSRRTTTTSRSSRISATPVQDRLPQAHADLGRGLLVETRNQYRHNSTAPGTFAHRSQHPRGPLRPGPQSGPQPGHQELRQLQRHHAEGRRRLRRGPDRHHPLRRGAGLDPLRHLRHPRGHPRGQRARRRPAEERRLLQLARGPGARTRSEKTSLYGMYGTSSNPSAEFGRHPQRER